MLPAGPRIDLIEASRLASSSIGDPHVWVLGRIAYPPDPMPVAREDKDQRDAVSALLDQFFEALDHQRQLLSAGDDEGADRAFHRGVDLVREMVHAIDRHPPDPTNE